jgi:hypothetical protein
MAVIQISKIQHRRGLKNNNVGIPQLSSAELAWAIDTQELYIGNGSIAEGSPYVGNTKILTEHDNIIELASSYRFGSTEPSIVLSVPRSLSSKLDEYVSVLDFGAVPDGSTDCTDAFEDAFSQLFRNPDSKFKKTLLVPNGVYLFNTRDLNIPSNARIKGETQTGVVLDLYANDILLITELGTEVTGPFTSTDRPTNITISNLTIAVSTGQLVITGLKDSLFEDVIFTAGYQLGNPVPSVVDAEAAVFWENTLFDTRVNNIQFENCKFLNHRVGLHCIQTDDFETQITINNSSFLENHSSILINGVANQINKWVINQSKFEEIGVSVFNADQGRGTLIRDCEFINCGNVTGNASNPSSPFISFGQHENNIVIDCISDRQQSAGITLSDTTPAFSEVENASFSKFVNSVYSQVYLTDSFLPLTVFSSANRFTTIEYTLTLGNYNRHGMIHMTIDDVQATVAITDSYQYSSSLITDPGGLTMTNFEFNATLLSNRDDTTLETVLISYKNPISSGLVGNINFFANYGV